MKKITLLLLTLLTMSLGHSQGCVGNSSDAIQGTFSYNYSFVTNGTNVTVTFEILGTFTGLVGQLKQGNSFTNMTPNPMGSQTFQITLPNQVNGTDINLAFYGPYANAGLLETINYVYTVGTTCAPTCTDGVQNGTETGIDCGGPCTACDVTKPTGFTATAGSIGAFSVELLLTATDETSANITYNITGGATAQTTGASGVQKSIIIGLLTPSTPYSFNITARDASGNSTLPIAVNVNTVADASTACAGQSSEAGTSSSAWAVGYNYTIETLPSGTDVKFTIEILDTGIPAVVAQLQQENPTTYSNMTNASGQIYEYTVSGLTNGAVISYAGRFAYTGGALITKFFQYTVGDACALGTKDFKIAGLNVSPNPSNNSWNVTTKSINMSSITVYDILGKNVLSLNPNASEASINGSSLKSGLYFAQIKTANGVSSIKLVKE